MIRLLTAAALAALLASPVMAQSVSPNDPYSSGSSSSTMQNQGSTTSPGSSSSESMGSQLSPGGTASQGPTDCAPNDPRPECQTAQLPTNTDDSVMPTERGSSGSSGLGSGSQSGPSSIPESSSGSSGSSGSSAPSGSQDR
jgi:hypothetical protein